MFLSNLWNVADNPSERDAPENNEINAGITI